MLTWNGEGLTNPSYVGNKNEREIKKKENKLFALYIGDLKEGMLTLSHVGRITISVGSNPMTNWNS